MSVGIKDRYLVERSFRIMCGGVENASVVQVLNKDMFYNFFSSAPGDNRYVNPLPGFSPACDPRLKSLMQNDGLGGMGPQYKRIYDDNASLVSFTVGVPEFTGLLTFVLNMFDPVAAIMANKGRSPHLTFYIGQAIGTMAYAPIQMVSIGFQFLTWLIDTPRNQFYYVKPAMGAYLQSATGLLNDLMVGMGYIKPLMEWSTNDVAPIGGIGKDNSKNYQNEINRLNQIFPDVVNGDGTIDLMRLVSRGTRKYRYMLQKLKDIDNANISSIEEKFNLMENVLIGLGGVPGMAIAAAGRLTSDYVKAEQETVAKSRGEEEGNYPEQASAYLNQGIYNNVYQPDGVKLYDESGQEIDNNVGKYFNTSTTNFNGGGSGGTGGLDSSGTYTQATPNDPQPGTTPDSKEPPKQATTFRYEENKNDQSWLGSITDLLKTQFAGGFDAITWRCEHLGAVTDSFSNSFGPSPMAEKFNSMTRAATDIKFDLAGGATGIPIFDTAISMAKDAVIGVASSLQIANIPMAIANNSYVNIPDHWQDASANIHRESYRFTFESLYAHPYSQITNLWIYFALLAPLFMPNSAGGSMYTSPFMLKVFSKSRQIIRVGMVESATITFGEGVGGWTKDRKPLNMTIEISIADMEKFISIPITRTSGVLDMLTNPAAGVRRMLTDVGKYNEYLTRLSGQDYLDTVLRWNQLSKRLTTVKTELKREFSSSNIAAMVGDSVVGDIGHLFTRQISR